MRYFSNFPLINYSNNLVKNIFSRIRFASNIDDYAKTFYPYELKEKERLDMIAFDYYEDQYNDWLIYFANQIVDPYHGVYLSSEDFDNYITKKYGSVSAALEKIVYYRNNWTSDDQVLTTSAYNALSSELKKYWAPVLSINGTISGYERAKLDTVVTTNKIVGLSVTFNTGNSFVSDEKISLKNGSSFIANGVVSFSNSSYTVVRHIEGSFSNNSSYVLSGASSNATITAVSNIANNLSTTESIYYSPVNAYDYENELNEQKKNIELLDNRYSATVERQFRNLLNP